MSKNFVPIAAASEPRPAALKTGNPEDDVAMFSLDEELYGRGWETEQKPAAAALVAVRNSAPETFAVRSSSVEEMKARVEAAQAAKVLQNPAVKVTIGFHPKTQAQPLVAADKGSNHKAV